jgi:ABC-type transporter Mla subunit MlaD
MKPILTVLAVALLGAGHLNAQSQLLPMSQVDQDLAQLNTSIQRSSYYLGQAIAAFNDTHAVWQLSDDRLERLLERLGPQQVAILKGAQIGTAQAYNAILDGAQSAQPRAIATPARTFTWDGTNVVLVPVPQPTPGPEPTPVPTPEPTPEEPQE